jgi:hypothetical protein
MGEKSASDLMPSTVTRVNILKISKFLKGQISNVLSTNK